MDVPVAMLDSEVDFRTTNPRQLPRNKHLIPAENCCSNRLTYPYNRSWRENKTQAHYIDCWSGTTAPDYTNLKDTKAQSRTWVKPFCCSSSILSYSQTSWNYTRLPSLLHGYNVYFNGCLKHFWEFTYPGQKYGYKASPACSCIWTNLISTLLASLIYLNKALKVVQYRSHRLIMVSSPVSQRRSQPSLGPIPI